MKALSVRQPWAWAITHGQKDIENRTWTTGYRGPLAIHAGARWDEDGAYDKRILRALHAFGDRFDPPLRVERLGHKTMRLLRDRQLTPSAIVAVVDVVGICTARSMSEQCGCGLWAAEGQCHWRLANPRPLPEPVPCKGRLSLWELPADVEARALAQVAG
ncbi:ASCH domain-containing protein [Nonomuraea sp. NPDC049400]|uniref:ASCH domain-containing protein n=1 Tax=Nonomuraea sp. NPDC049400 TaxID=3364352 RepID=UPI0037B0CAA2